MSKLNDIFKKVAELEKNAQEVKLGMHEVELTKIDDYTKKLFNVLGNKITEYENLINQTIKAKDLLKKTYDKINKEGDQLYAEYDVKARELGIAMNDIPNFRKMWEAKTFTSEAYYNAIEKKL